MKRERLYRITLGYRARHVGAIAGEVYRGDRVVLGVSELVWEPVGQAPGYDPGER